MNVIDITTLVLTEQGFTVNDLDLSNRLANFKHFLREYCVDYFLPVHEVFFEKWVSYINLDKEDVKQYDELKKLFIKDFSASNFDLVLHYSRYFWRNSVLIKKQLTDIDSDEWLD